jgi:hypothetical protein
VETEAQTQVVYRYEVIKTKCGLLVFPERELAGGYGSSFSPFYRISFLYPTFPHISSHQSLLISLPCQVILDEIK